jgi:hypothetical protein
MSDENRIPNLGFLKKYTTSAKIAELDIGNEGIKKGGDGGASEETELNLRELVNPCSKMREDRVERRVSERLQEVENTT